MTPLQPGELSAYLDGELSAERMREVESILASDPALRAEFEALTAADANWRAAARSAAFHPKVTLPVEKHNAISLPIVAAFLVLVIVMQFVLRRLDVIVYTIALNAVALMVVLIGVTVALTETGTDRYRRMPE